MLDTQNISVNLLGLDTKTDPKMLQPGSLTAVENGVFTQGGTIQKRNGYTALSNNYGNATSSGTFNAGESCAVYNNQLLMFNEGNVYSYLESTGNWVQNGYTSPINISDTQVVNNTNTQYNCDSAILNGTVVYAWEELVAGNTVIKYSVQDNDTQTYYVNSVLLSVNAMKPKVLAFQNYLFIYYLYKNGAQVDLKIVRISPLNPYVYSSALLASNVNTSFPNYEAIVADYMFIVYNTTNATSQMELSYVNAAMGIQSYDGYNDGYSVGFLSGGALTAIFDVNNNNIHIAFDGYNITTGQYTGLQGFGITSTFGFLYNDTIIDTANTTRNITGVVSDAGNYSNITWYYEQIPNNSLSSALYRNGATYASQQYYPYDGYGLAIDGYILHNTITSTNTIINAPYVSVGTSSIFARSVGLISKAFTYNGIAYVNVAYQGAAAQSDAYYSGPTNVNLQQTYFTLNQNGVLVGKFLPYTAGGLVTGNTLPQVWSSSTGVFNFLGHEQGSVIANNNTYTTSLGLTNFEISFVNQAKYQTCKLGNQLYVTGGIVSQYDGYNWTESGFAVWPENIGLSYSSTGGSILPGNYEYQIIYRWIDNQGVVHNSYPSIPVNITVPAGTSTNSIILNIPTLRVTNKSNCTIEVFRSQAQGGTLYRVTANTGGIANNISVDTVTYVDTQSDSSILGNELLYTTGGVIPNDSVPAASLCVVYNNRVWLAGLENPNELWYSKEFSPGSDIGFSASFVLRTPEGGGSNGNQGGTGAITALAVMDGKLIIFKENSIYYEICNGPDNTGANSDIVAPTFIPNDAGCSSPNSVCVVGGNAGGVLFQSSKGIYILNRSLVTQYIGAQVEAFNGLTVTSATLVENTNEIRFTTLQTNNYAIPSGVPNAGKITTYYTGTTLVYNYYFQLWSTFTNQPAVSAVIWNGDFTYLTPYGQTLTETVGLYSDNLRPIALTISTGYIALGGLQGYQRIYQINVLGNYYTSHLLDITLEYDNKVAPSETKVFSTSKNLNLQYWGSDGYYGYNKGYNTYWGDGDNCYEFEFKPMVQQCRAVKITFTDNDLNSPGAAYSINNITFRVGVNKGLNRLPASKQI